MMKHLKFQTESAAWEVVAELQYFPHMYDVSPPKLIEIDDDNYYWQVTLITWQRKEVV